MCLYQPEISLGKVKMKEHWVAVSVNVATERPGALQEGGEALLLWGRIQIWRFLLFCCSLCGFEVFWWVVEVLIHLLLGTGEGGISAWCHLCGCGSWAAKYSLFSLPIGPLAL